jgi:FtsZ-binding cell division protein ZapB
MFSRILLKMELRKLKNRADKLREKLAIQGLTNELLVEMQKLQRDANDLEERINDELEKLGLNK